MPPTALELQSRFQVRIPRASVEKMRKLQKILAYDEDNDGVARMEVADDHTLDTNAHKQWLLTEGTKKRPNYEEVEARMTLIFSDRRNEIIKENIPIAQLKDSITEINKSMEEGIPQRPHLPLAPVLMTIKSNSVIMGELVHRKYLSCGLGP